ncbi:hypothetical protein QTG54_011767 [Skeletonema marinoi]|uniref:Uncharacterized protein n=1 Tax=Skeletonema marinoi TaxID=267567 RepID=A0AAD8Y0R3_9STRA|nr:hypothetical protein QTG54_011767 [Skeletonema marinoi]
MMLYVVLVASSLQYASAFSSTTTNRITTPTTNNLQQRRQFLSSISTSIIVQSLATQPANAAIRDPKQTWDEDDNPFASLSESVSFSRLDASDDKIFYAEPRFVEHVDQQAVDSITSYVSDSLLQNGDSVLDLCSSWTSHITPGKLDLKRVAGLGMNAKELEANKALTEWAVQDLMRTRTSSYRSDDIEHAYTVGSYLHYCGGGFGDIKAEDLSTRKKSGKERMIVGDPLYVITATKS